MSLFHNVPLKHVFSDNKSMLNFIHACLVSPSQTVVYTTSSKTPHYSNIRKDQASPASHSHTGQRERTEHGRHSHPENVQDFRSKVSGLERLLKWVKRGVLNWRVGGEGGISWPQIR